MARRHERKPEELQRRVEQKTDRVLALVAIAGLVACSALNAAVLILAPEQSRAPVPDQVFWFLGAALVPDFIKWIRGVGK